MNRALTTVPTLYVSLTDPLHFGCNVSIDKKARTLLKSPIPASATVVRETDPRVSPPTAPRLSVPYGGTVGSTIDVIDIPPSLPSWVRMSKRTTSLGPSQSHPSNCARFMLSNNALRPPVGSVTITCSMLPVLRKPPSVQVLGASAMSSHRGHRPRPRDESTWDTRRGSFISLHAHSLSAQV